MPLPSHLLLHELFERSAAAYPGRVAIDVPPSGERPRRTVTYRELDEEACALAERLREHAGPESIVALFLPRDGHLLYLAQLAVLKAGAAYTALDPSFPDERVRILLDDAKPVVILTCTSLMDRLAGRVGAPVLDLDAAFVPRTDVAVAEPPRERGGPRSLCYVIFTSGTTGRPKGVLIEHRSVVNLIESDLAYFGFGPHERFGQSSSPSFDSSVEETWMAFASGGALVVMNDDVVRLGPDLVPWLRRERVSVIGPPPTLLRASACADPEAELPDLRVLYVGGEALPEDLAERWARGRRLVNGYGPTECTVTAMRAHIRPGDPVSIGQAVSGNHAVVVDVALLEVGEGVVGELCIGGVGLARGYLNAPELTAERFFEHSEHGRLYRTGDLVRRLPSGDHECFGRIDAQVKIRGYRVELGEIEAHLAACAGVRTAACKLEGQQLVGFLVTDGSAVDLEEARTSLRERVPAYMVPVRLVLIDSLPTTIGGKLDRRALPDILGEAAAGSERPGPRDGEEALLLPVLAEVLGHGVGPDDDFFESGGDSLAAARFVTELRRDARTAALTVRDVYDAPTAAALAARLRSRETAPPRGPRPRTRMYPKAVTAAQAAWLGAEVFVGSVVAYGLLFEALPFVATEVGLTAMLLLGPLTGLALSLFWLPFALGNALLWKKILIGKYRAGVYPLWGGFFLRHWIVAHLTRAIPFALVEGTVFHGGILRILGARIGKRVHLPAGAASALGCELLDIGDDASIGQEAELRVIDYVDQHMIIGAITIGARATLETRAGMGPGSSIGEDAYLTALSMLPAGARIPAGERWDGVPAVKLDGAPAALEPRGRSYQPATHGLLLIAARFGVGLFWWLPFLALAFSLSQGFSLDLRAIAAWLADPPASHLGIIAALAVAGTVVSVAASALVMRFLGRVHAGVVPRYGPAYLRAFLKNRILQSASKWLSGTLFWPWWLRAAGMKVGRRCEVSSIIGVTPELVSLQEDCFLADGVYLGTPRVHRGTVTLGEVSFGRSTFIGNHAVIHPDTHLPGDLLLGVCTVADRARVRQGSSWFGHPAFELPRREVVTLERSLTHAPPWYRWLNRFLWEAARFLLPVLPTYVFFAVIALLLSLEQRVCAPAFLCGVVPLVALGTGAVFCAVVWAMKWTLLGRVRPGQHALWSCWCSRWDFLYVAWGVYAGAILTALEGSLLLAPWLRGMGVRVGRRVFLGGGFAHVVDPDMLRLEDDATVLCHFQAHSFEDRVLKIGYVDIRRGSSTGAGSVILYGAEVGEGTRLSEHSVLMKHEALLPGRYYAGAPSRPMAEPGDLTP